MNLSAPPNITSQGGYNSPFGNTPISQKTNPTYIPVTFDAHLGALKLVCQLFVNLPLFVRKGCNFRSDTLRAQCLRKRSCLINDSGDRCAYVIQNGAC